MASFLDVLEVEQDASPHTLAAYRRDLRGLLEVLPEGTDPADVTAQDLCRFSPRHSSRPGSADHNG